MTGDTQVDLSPEVLTQPFTVVGGIKTILKLAIPMSMSQLTVSLVGIVSVYFAGQLGVTELGAASMTFSFINATSFSVAAGFCGALETLFSQTFGADPESKLYGTYAQRMGILLAVMAVPIALLFAFCEPLMVAVGQTPGVAHHVALFTQLALIGLLPSMFMEIARRYYQCQHLTVPVTVATSFGAIFVNPITIIVLMRLGMGYAALPLAWSLLQITMLASLCWYARRCGLAQRTWGGFTAESFQDFGPMLRLGSLSFLMIVSEFIVVEVNSISAGFLDEVSLAAFSISGQLTFFTWNLAAGFYSAMSALVGSLIGAGQTEKARQYAALGTFLVVCLGFVNIIWMYFLGNTVARFFTDSEEVLEAFKPILPCAMLFHLADAPQSNSLGILRGAGLQKKGAISVAVGYGLLGMPLGWLLCFYFDYGVAMLWLGPAIGCIVGGWPMCFLSVFRGEWPSPFTPDEVPNSTSTSTPPADIFPHKGIVIGSTIADGTDNVSANQDTLVVPDVLLSLNGDTEMQTEEKRHEMPLSADLSLATKEATVL